MKIVLLAHSYPPAIGGGESHVFTVAKILDQKGYCVTVITGMSSPDQIGCRPRLKNVKLIEINRLKEAALGLEGFRNVSADLYNALKKINPDVVHVHNFGPCLLLSLVSSHFKFKVCFTYHSTPIPEEQKIIGYFKDYGLEKAFCSYVFEKAKYDVLICPSNYYRDWAIKLGAPKQKTRLIYHGVDKDIFNPIKKNYYNYYIRKRLGYHHNDYLICSPIRLIKRKGALELIEALGLIKDDRVKLLIPTSNSTYYADFRKVIESKIRKLQLNDRIKFLWGRVSYLDMPKIYKASDLTVLPSHREGLGLVLLEAMACGCPVVATDTFGINEVVKSGVNGLLVEPRNAAALAQAIKKIKQDDKLRNKIIKGGYQSVDQKFNALRQVNELLKEYGYKKVEKSKE